MGTTRIKVIDLASDKQEIKTSRKHAPKAALGKLKESAIVEKTEIKPAITPDTEKKKTSPSVKSVVARHRGAKYQKALQLVDRTKTYPVEEALGLLYKTSFTKFDPTVEAHLNVSDQNIRGTVNFPHVVGSKKERKYLVFSDQRLTANHKQIIYGDEKTIENIETGRLKPNRDFDMVIAQPKFMAKLTKVAKILGPRGMMPNPKNQTVTDDPEKFIKNHLEVEGFEYKTDPVAPIIHIKLGRLSLKPEQLLANLKALISAVGPTKIKKVTLKSTMSPGIKVDIGN